MKNKKVLHVGPLPPPIGGISTFILNLKKYSTISYDLQFFNIFPKKDKPLNKKVNNLTVLFKYFFYLLIKKPDLVHIHTASYLAFTKSFALQEVSKLLNKKVIMHMHSGRFMKYYHESSPKTQEMVVRTLKKSDKVVCLSDTWRDIYIETFGIPASKFVVIPNAIFTNEFLDLKPDFSTPKKNVLFVGLLSENKGLYDIIEMAKRLKNDPEVTFKLMGDGPMKEELQQQIKEHDLNMELLGSLSGKAKFDEFEKAQILILPSYFEGLSITVLEAMAAGLVVLTTDVGAMADVVPHGKGGYVYEPGDVDAFTEKITKLTQDEMKEISSFNREASQQYDFKQLNRNLEELYDDFLKK